MRPVLNIRLSSAGANIPGEGVGCQGGPIPVFRRRATRISRGCRKPESDAAWGDGGRESGLVQPAVLLGSPWGGIPRAGRGGRGRRGARRAETWPAVTF